MTDEKKWTAEEAAAVWLKEEGVSCDKCCWCDCADKEIDAIRARKKGGNDA